MIETASGQRRLVALGIVLLVGEAVTKVAMSLAARHLHRRSA